MTLVQLFRKVKVIYAILPTLLLLKYEGGSAQALTVLAKNKTYCQEVQKDSLLRMVELKSLIPGVLYDLRYATRNNFTHTKWYKNGRMTFLRLEPAEALYKVQSTLKNRSLGLKIFDAYRPYYVTERMWDQVRDERYVANPSKGSGHNRGLAVDLTIVELKTGRELDMGASFDNFTDSAHLNFNGLTATQLSNRSLLVSIMKQFGFQPLETEWWHYSWPNNHEYAVLDLSFSAIINCAAVKGNF